MYIFKEYCVSVIYIYFLHIQIYDTNLEDFFFLIQLIGCITTVVANY